MSIFRNSDANSIMSWCIRMSSNIMNKLVQSHTKNYNNVTIVIPAPLNNPLIPSFLIVCQTAHINNSYIYLESDVLLLILGLRFI